MDLLNIDTVLQPESLAEVPPWQPGWAWLAGGTWLFSEPQPQLTTLVDLQRLNWSELTVDEAGITIGATCPMTALLDLPPEPPAMAALQQAVHELASFKVQGSATVAGNLCLALPASTFAPVMVLLAARYEILGPDGSRWIEAVDFQLGAQQTQLQPGEVMRRIHIPPTYLHWPVSYQRLCIASAGIAVSIVVAARHPDTGDMRYGVGGAIATPQLIELPSGADIWAALDEAIGPEQWLDNVTGSAAYRRHVTGVLMGRGRESGVDE